MPLKLFLISSALAGLSLAVPAGVQDTHDWDYGRSPRSLRDAAPKSLQDTTDDGDYCCSLKSLKKTAPYSLREAAPFSLQDTTTTAKEK